ncbi:MAG: branched chain amino acid aminotransferase [Deltaproteobacteria bacterium]|nr:branched chain amino acid aminotransferase [Deltaproteobacteria bacterium]
MSIRSSYIWMDGEMVPFENATTHILSHSLHYGLGVFEGIRSYDQVGGGGGIFKLEEHIRRLLDSAKMCRMEVPYTLEEIRQACLDTLIKNEFESAYIRPLIYLGMGGMGLGARNNPVHVSIIVWKWGAYLGDEGIQNGIRVATSSFTRHHVNANLQRAKITGHYVNSIMARYEANDNGFDEAIMLDHSGYVAEGTGENLFIIRDGVVKTPPIQNILGGITRKTAIQILENEGLKVHEMLFGRDALYISDEIFMTGTAAEVTPIREVDRREVGPPGPITKMVQETYVNGVRGQVDWMKPFITTY